MFSQLIEVQAEFHRKSLTLLQAVLPQIKAQQGEYKPSLEGKVGGLVAFPSETDFCISVTLMLSQQGHI